MTDREFFGHPRGLSTAFFTEMWERFSYYGIRPLLVLFMTAALFDGGFGFDRATASAIVGVYAASVYLASLPGGWVADRWLGLQRSIWYGGIFITAGHAAIALSAVFVKPAFFTGLVLIVIGTGLLKPNVSAIVGDLYPERGARRDAGFSIFYMGINIGALIAPIITGFLGERVGWHWGFGAAGVGMLIGLITFRLRAAATFHDIGSRPSGTEAQQRQARTISLGMLAVIALVVMLAATGVIAVNPVAVAGNMTALMLTLVAIAFAWLFLLAGLDADEKKRVAVILVLFLFSMVFWAAFEQQPTSLNLFARDFTDRTVLGWEIPTTWLQSAESFFVVTLAPVLAALWLTLEKKGRNPSSPAKFAIGLFMCALAFQLMVVASRNVVASGGTLRVSILWLISCYALQAVGELALSPVGLSSMTKLAPRRFAGLMMGIWFTAIALGNLFAGLVGGNVDPERLEAMPLLFQRTTLALTVSALVLLMLVIPIRRMMATVSGSRET
ncbi:MAG: peptide MFS transporter [Gemmatimonadota bacterium]